MASSLDGAGSSRGPEQSAASATGKGELSSAERVFQNFKKKLENSKVFSEQTRQKLLNALPGREFSKATHESVVNVVKAHLGGANRAEKKELNQILKEETAALKKEKEFKADAGVKLYNSLVEQIEKKFLDSHKIISLLDKHLDYREATHEKIQGALTQVAKELRFQDRHEEAKEIASMIHDPHVSGWVRQAAIDDQRMSGK